jgi:hypothetical protein
MITNASLTIYHKEYDEETRLDKWKRYNYDKVWFFGGKGASINKGYDNANNVDVRIPYDNNLNINNIAIGDILVKGTITNEISTQQDLLNYEIYNITSITDNKFGNNPHIHIGGR